MTYSFFCIISSASHCLYLSFFLATELSNFDCFLFLVSNSLLQSSAFLPTVFLNSFSCPPGGVTLWQPPPPGVRVHKVCCCWSCPQTQPLRRSPSNQLRHQSHLWPTWGPQVHWSLPAVGVPLNGPWGQLPLGHKPPQSPRWLEPSWAMNMLTARRVMADLCPALHVGIKVLLWWTLALSCLYSWWQPRPHPRHSQSPLPSSASCSPSFSTQLLQRSFLGPWKLSSFTASSQGLRCHPDFSFFFSFSSYPVM